MKWAIVALGTIAAVQGASVAAQNHFEGVLTQKTGMAKGGGTESHLYLKGNQARLERSGSPGALIKDANGRLMTVMDAAKRYILFGSVPESGLKFEPIGKSETVAGYSCKYYKVIHTRGSGHPDDQACVTNQLGFVGLGIGGGPGLEERALKSQFPDGFLVLKLLDEKGVTSMETFKVERRPLSDAMFAPPVGYTEMKMPGGVGPQRP